MLARLLVLVLLLGLVTLAYRWWQGRQGTVRRVERPGALGAATLGAQPGARATFVQFSTPMCAKCPPTAVLLKKVAGEQPHVTHIEIDAAERLDLARENDRTVRAPAAVQRLHAKAIARGQHAPFTRVPQHESEHTEQPVEARFSPTLVGGEHDLGIRCRAKCKIAELGSQLNVVIDLPVEDKMEPAIRGGNRLPTCIRQINDR